ncbi:MAG TPA: FAD:protein FMN transferase [Phycisphaerae bacterium]|nr:FAD:protein FMN transferase [Phycisphaerae bacterium]HNU44279.1 FAD:protein FMN transferase [Phycisphaerae bacterium]
MRAHWLRLTVLGLLLLSGCRRGPEAHTVRRSREVMGTFAEITAVAPDEAVAEAAVEAAYGRLNRVNDLMSTYRPDSEISRVNQLAPGQSLAISPETFHVLERAQAFAEATGGAFDVTCRPLLLCWREASEAGRLPTPEQLDAARARVGWQKLTLAADGRSASPAVAGVQVDLGAIAKGYALDLATEALREAGAVAGLVNVGGDVRGFGSRADGEPWQIGIRHPFRQALFGRIRLVDRAVATSGIQQRFFEVDGRRYSHIVDPRTGRPAEQAPSVTVVAPDGLTADAWATAFSVLSVEEGRGMAEDLPNVKVLWIWGSAEHPQTAQTPGFSELLVQ